MGVLYGFMEVLGEFGNYDEAMRGLVVNKCESFV